MLGSSVRPPPLAFCTRSFGSAGIRPSRCLAETSSARRERHVRDSSVAGRFANGSSDQHLRSGRGSTPLSPTASYSARLGAKSGQSGIRFQARAATSELPAIGGSVPTYFPRGSRACARLDTRTPPATGPRSARTRGHRNQESGVRNQASKVRSVRARMVPYPLRS